MRMDTEPHSSVDDADRLRDPSGISFSLVMCTVDRVHEPECFLQSLADQAHKNFELIVVDQNADDRVRNLVARFQQSFAITSLQSPRGLSRARNVALPHLRGDIVAFPDDDCTYPGDLLEGVAMRFCGHREWQGLAIRRTDRFDPGSRTDFPTRLHRGNIWGRVPSISLFMRRDLVTSVGSFDETLGAGSGTRWGAGEDTDYVLRALRQEAVWYLDPSLQVLHPPTVKNASPEGKMRARSYSRGLGRVLRKNELPMWMVLGGCGLSAIRAAGAVLRGDASEAGWHFETLLGRIEGWLDATDGVFGNIPEGRQPPEDIR